MKPLHCICSFIIHPIFLAAAVALGNSHQIIYADCTRAITSSGSNVKDQVRFDKPVSGQLLKGTEATGKKSQPRIPLLNHMLIHLSRIWTCISLCIGRQPLCLARVLYASASVQSTPCSHSKFWPGLAANGCWEGKPGARDCACHCNILRQQKANLSCHLSRKA